MLWMKCSKVLKFYKSTQSAKLHPKMVSITNARKKWALKCQCDSPKRQSVTSSISRENSWDVSGSHPNRQTHHGTCRFQSLVCAFRWFLAPICLNALECQQLSPTYPLAPVTPCVQLLLENSFGSYFHIEIHIVTLLFKSLQLRSKARPSTFMDSSGLFCIVR